MQRFIKKYKEKHGYTPSIYELFNLYRQGFLTLSDKQENELLKEFEKNNLN